jgi:hypothetical protein
MGSIMRLRLMQFPRLARLVALAAAVATGACSPVIGLEGYSTRAETVERGEGPTSADAGPDSFAEAAADGTAGCDVDLTTQCYACAPMATPQFLNACTSAQCVPFDDVKRLTHLLPKGGLPPLPPEDAGSD